MKIFIDSANLEEIKKAKEMGVLDGITTNPTLLAKEKAEPHFQLEKICKLIDGPVSAEVVSLEYKEMVKEAKELAKISPNIVIKIPSTVEGLKATKELTTLGIKTNLTLCFSPAQAILVAKVGATYISAFVGRLDDISYAGMELVKQIKNIYAQYKYPTQIIVASIRHPMHFVEAGLSGADVATIPFAVIEKLMLHPLTDIGIKRFLEDWQRLKDGLSK